VNQTAPVPRRIRATLGEQFVVDTTSALYVWEWPHYPQYYIPIADVDPAVLVDEQHEEKLSRGTARRHGLRAGGVSHPAAVLVYGDDAIEGLAGMARLEWAALDAWHEEDEQVFVHPATPIPASMHCARLAVSASNWTATCWPSPTHRCWSSRPGCRPRYYLNRTELSFTYLTSTSTATACPYKGITSGYWTAQIGEASYPDIAWTYDFPTRHLLPITGLVAFYNERVDITLDGQPLTRPVTHFS